MYPLVVETIGEFVGSAYESLKIISSKQYILKLMFGRIYLDHFKLNLEAMLERSWSLYHKSQGLNLCFIAYDWASCLTTWLHFSYLLYWGSYEA